MSSPVNPYIFGPPVGDKENVFVGRKDIWESLRSSLQSAPENIFLLYGQRRVGKTSVLQYLTKQLKSEGLFNPVYFSLQGKSEYSLAKVLQNLGDTIANQLGLPNPRKDLLWQPEQAFHKDWLPKVFQALPEGTILVLLFDEFDVLADPSERPPTDTDTLPASHLFKYLKTLASDYRQKMKLVFVIGRNKEDLSLIAQNLFRGILPSHLISLLSPRDVGMIARLSEHNNTLFWTDAAIGRVIQLTNGHPYFTQALCSHIWESAHKGDCTEVPTVTDREVDKAVPDFLHCVTHHLESLWNSWSEEERVAAAALGQIGAEPATQEQLESLLQEKSQLPIVIRQVQDAMQRLQERDVFETVQGRVKFRVELVRQWIHCYKPLNVVQDEIDDARSAAAEDFYNAGRKLYDAGEIKEAIEPARQAFEKLRYRSAVVQLWADILVYQEKFTEAEELLEQLHEYAPSDARAGLIKLYLLLAEKSQGDNQKLDWYERVLVLEPSRSQALEGAREIWRFKAETAERLAISTDQLETWEEACAFYRKIDRKDKVSELEQKIRQRILTEGQQQLDQLEQAKRYTEALDLLKELKSKCPDPVWDKYHSRLTDKADLATDYQKAIIALSKGEQKDAQKLLIHVINRDPHYEQATVYLHQAVKGEDFSGLFQQLAESQGQCTQIEGRVQALQVEIGQAHTTIAQLNEVLALSNTTRDQLESRLNSVESDMQKEVEIRCQCEREMGSQKKLIASLQQELQQQRRQHNEALEEKEKAAQQQIQAIEQAWMKKWQLLEKERDSHLEEKEKLENNLEKLKKDLEYCRESRSKDMRTIREERAKSIKFRNLLIALSVMFLLCIVYILLTS